MIVLAREVLVCKCSTNVPLTDPNAEDFAREVRFVQGGEPELEKLDPAHHNPEHVAELTERLKRGEYWMVGLVDDKIVTYTWLHTRSVIDYPYLPGCTFNVAADVGYGYDAWTPPDLRGGGLRRVAFLEELRVLRTMEMRWEASFFVKHQIEGAQRSLAKVGIEIIPLWRVRLQRDRSPAMENLVPSDTSLWPVSSAAKAE